MTELWSGSRPADLAPTVEPLVIEGNTQLNPGAELRVNAVAADPEGGARIASDMATRLGWIGGTDHLTANPIFQDVIKGGTMPPPETGAKLVVFDADGGLVGEVTLQSGQGSGGRIALFSGGAEQSYVNLE